MRRWNAIGWRSHIEPAGPTSAPIFFLPDASLGEIPDGPPHRRVALMHTRAGGAVNLPFAQPSRPCKESDKQQATTS